VAIAGLLMGIVYARTQNLWLVICLHTVFDAIWSVTPVFSPPFPYSVGVLVLIASSLIAMGGGGSLFKRA
jgi:membrane protease YdiL (CAAX protease family)